ncbi:hypothetical protein ENUP19_0188G0009 [Entamoeba nuttalli]|uniref:Pescadillo homolog n=1 Tax=Entamoeba nuttalli TaxID=412467 RepID=A0ABQ0DN66_9EUKA
MVKGHGKHQSKRFAGKKEKAPKISKYITRTQAIKRLNCTMEQFRKICILKGVSPRLPSKGLNTLTQKKTYYHIDDIKPLVNDKVTLKIKQIRAFKKHIRKLTARKEFKTKEQLLKTKPVIDLASTIQERYPTFQDALNELGDCLSMVFMFASYRVSKGEKAEAVRLARRIAMEWEAYIKHTNALRKCFISYKGYFYTAVVYGIAITWMVPHQFAIEKNETVDFNVLHEFLSFYVVLMKFINYKLYTNAGLNYPPEITKINGVEFLGTVQLEPLQLQKETEVVSKDHDVQELNEALKQVKGEGENLATEMLVNHDTGASVQVTSHFVQSSGSGLFSGLVFYIQREVPRHPVAFVIETLGGIIVDNVDDESITHQIGERGEHKNIEREFIQPQWIFDCVNENFILPCGEYTIGQKLPPHLSPYVNEEEEGYITERRKQLDAIKNNTKYDYEEEQKKEEESKKIQVKDLESDFVDGLVEEMGEEKKGKAKAPSVSKEAKKAEQEKKRKMAVLSGKDRRIVMKNEMLERRQTKKVNKFKERLAKSKEQK